MGYPRRDKAAPPWLARAFAAFSGLESRLDGSFPRAANDHRRPRRWIVAPSPRVAGI